MTDGTEEWLADDCMPYEWFRTLVEKELNLSVTSSDGTPIPVLHVHQIPTTLPVIKLEARTSKCHDEISTGRMTVNQARKMDGLPPLMFPEADKLIEPEIINQQCLHGLPPGSVQSGGAEYRMTADGHYEVVFTFIAGEPEADMPTIVETP